MPYKVNYYLYSMQAKTLLYRTGCSDPILKDWVKKKVILPIRPGQGPGIHAEYDEANAVALLVGLKMKHAAITVAKYAPAFAELHMWLRAHSSLEWTRQTVVMTPNTVIIYPGLGVIKTEVAVVTPLSSICSTLSQNAEYDQHYQWSLLGLEAIRRT